MWIINVKDFNNTGVKGPWNNNVMMAISNNGFTYNFSSRVLVDSASVPEGAIIIKSPTNIRTLLSPIDEEKNVPIITTFKRETFKYAFFDNLHILSKPEFSNLVIFKFEIKDTTFSANSLKNDTTYYWHVSTKIDSRSCNFLDV